MPPSVGDPMYFVWWLVFMMLAQCPLRMHDNYTVVGAGQSIYGAETTPLFMRIYEMVTCGKMKLSKFKTVFCDIIARENLRTQIVVLIDMAICHHGNHIAVLQEFIIATTMQIKTIRQTSPPITPSQLRSKIRVCDMIIDVCTRMLNPLLHHRAIVAAVQAESPIRFLEQELRDLAIEYTDEGILVPGQS